MALFMYGSAKILAKTNPRIPARNPEIAPRRTIFSSTAQPCLFSEGERSVAGKSEEVASVVDPLVHGEGLTEDRGHPLIDADEVVEDEAHQHGDPEQHRDARARQCSGYRNRGG